MTNHLPSDTFCLLPWIHLSTKTDGGMRVCCQANDSKVGIDGNPTNLNHVDFATAWNSSYMRNVRKEMLAGVKPAPCTMCWNEESVGIRSKRLWENDYWLPRVNLKSLLANTTEDGSADLNLSYIELRLGTKCQLACVMCSPRDSSTWVKEYNTLIPNITNQDLLNQIKWKKSINGSSYNWHKQNPVFWQQFYDQIPNMQQLYFAGGESLIIEEHYAILEECIRQGHSKHIELRYNTNGVEWRNDLLELWKEFQHVKVQYSVDSIGKMNEYIRYPSNWDRNLEAFNQLDNTGDNVEVVIQCAIQILNVYYIPDFIKWKMQYGFKKISPWPIAAGSINSHLVHKPVFLNIKTLPHTFKLKVREKYEEFFKWWDTNWNLGLDSNITYEQWKKSNPFSKLQTTLTFMESEDWSNRLSETKEFLELTDSQRGLVFEDTFPELVEIFKDV